MDVGADNFRFTLGDPEAKATTTREPMTSELRLNSLDRFTFAQLPYVGIPVLLTPPYSNDGRSSVVTQNAGRILLGKSNTATDNCLLQTKRNLLYGYFSRVALTQFQLNYNVPTIVTGYNDVLAFTTTATGVAPQFVLLREGYYTPAQLALEIQTQVRASAGNPLPAFICLPPQNPATAGLQAPIAGGFAQPKIIASFQFSTGSGSTMRFILGYDTAGSGAYPQDIQERVAKLSRMLGLNKQSYGYNETDNPLTLPPTPWVAVQAGIPNLMPTDYVDIVSKTLSNYKDNKDDNSSEQAPGCVLGRIWLTEGQTATSVANGWPQASLQGQSPQVFVKNWYNPNWSQWSPNQSVSSVDITLLDMWGKPLFWSSTYPTEWSATITATE
jgi:hypothetical protein